MRQWLEKLKSAGRDQILILLLTGVLLLVIALPTRQPEEPLPSDIQTDTKTTVSIQSKDSFRAYAQALEQRLTEVLSQVEGAGKVEVMLTLKSDGRRILEKDTSSLEESSASTAESGAADSSSRIESSENTVFQRDSDGTETPYVTEITEPEIAGVLVVAQGGGNASVAAEITEAIRALFGVEAHKIRVMKMKAGG